MPYIPVAVDKRRRPKTDEEKLHLSQSLKGRKLGPYPRARGQAISRAKKGKLTRAMLDAVRASGIARRGKSVNNGLRGYKQTAEHVAKRAATQFGKKRSDETRKRMSDVRKGIQFSDEQKRRLSESALARHARGDHTPYRSKLEIRAGLILEPLGFTPQFRFEFGSSHPFDFCNRETKTLIEVNGCYWHAHECATCRRVPNDADAITVRDGAFIAEAESRGYRVIVLWQCDEDNWLNILGRERLL